MKLTLILLICYVGVTYQLGYPWSPIYRHSPRLFLPNNYNENDYHLSAKPAYDFEVADSLVTYDDDDIASSISDVQARIPFSSPRKLQKKFFVTSVFTNSLFNPFNFRPVTVTTLTTTALSVITSTAVLATVQTCIPANQFLTQAGPGGGPMVLTTTCGRRRRDIGQPVEGLIETQFADSISPTGVLPLAASSVAPNFVRYDDVKPELRSSQESLGEEDQRQMFRVNGGNVRQRRGLSLVVTVTLTSTSYSFSTTTLKKTVSLSGPAQLSCLPAGFAVC
ncbi:hypothetical protein GHT06_011335 [Daphnia sinensis]|uniref:Uncharacterized protein n=1 Tax=Daphnia sinensis TaxID=1820382 RepID=A0AAD5LTS2_9CRUS|nr:hypothetical protein GHT06_011335 [Daphnia sinensis]